MNSGFRISDAVRLQRSSVNLKSGRMLIRVMKTKIPLYGRLPAAALNALRALPAESPYFFWSGKYTVHAAIASAGRIIRTLMKLAKIEGGHPHQFRDTFSVRLLERGAKIRNVQLLLGHSSVKITEDFYSPWGREMQEDLDQDLAKLQA
jgi:integrase